MATVTTKITTLDALGMAVIVAVPKTTSTARHANVWTARTFPKAILASKTSRTHVVLPNSRGTVSATTTTIMVAAIGMVATAAGPRRTSNIAKCARAKTVRRRQRKIVPANSRAAHCLNLRETKTATMRTIIVDATGMEATAARSRTVARSIPSIVRLASV